MRKIKFRGKRPNSGKWITGSLAQLSGFSYILNDEHKIPDCSTEVLPDTVGQFTRLFDKNGKEIYEGDIIQIHEGRNDFKITSIVWNDEFLCYEPSNKDLRHALKARYSEHYKIIGNIHDNPELLTNK